MHWRYSIMAGVKGDTNSLTFPTYRGKVGLLIGITIHSIKLCSK